MDAPKLKAKRRGDPDKWRDYMKNYMREYRARQKVKPKPPADGIRIPAWDSPPEKENAKPDESGV